MQIPAGFRGAFRTDDVARALYSEGAGIFRIVPAAVAVPLDVDDIVRLVRWAGATGTPLVPRGGGSGTAGGNVGPGVVVDLTQACREPVTVDREHRTARTGASLTWREVNDAAAAHGLRLPPDPSSGAFCTLGGMVNTNAAGARSLKYGPLRDWVEAIEFVTADGEIGHAGREDLPPEVLTAAERRLHADVAPRMRQVQLVLEQRQPSTRKNSSGYFLARQPDNGWIRHLLIGSEGTLAVVTAVEVRLAPLAAHRSTLLVALAALDDVARAVTALTSHAPSAVELLDRTYLDFVRAAARGSVPERAEAVLLVEFESRDAARTGAVALAGIAASVVVEDDAAAALKLWELRHLASPILAGLPDHLRSLQVVEDGCVPLAQLGAYIQGLRRIVAGHGFRVVIFGHAGDGNVHANLLADVAAPDVATRLAACLKEVSSLQIALGGTLSGEHGDGRLRAPFLEALLGNVFVDVCRRVKAAFDPLNILNPGVKLAGPGTLPVPPDALKIGADAPSLAPEVVALLRQIERDASWGTFRLDLAPDIAPAHP